MIHLFSRREHFTTLSCLVLLRRHFWRQSRVSFRRFVLIGGERSIRQYGLEPVMRCCSGQEQPLNSGATWRSRPQVKIDRGSRRCDAASQNRPFIQACGKFNSPRSLSWTLWRLAFRRIYAETGAGIHLVLWL
jgi:hypothetical protein